MDTDTWNYFTTKARRQFKDLSVTLRDYDLVYLVIGFHIVSAYMFGEILNAWLPRRGTRLSLDGTTYMQKLELLSSLDLLPESVISSLQSLDALNDACWKNRSLEPSTDAIEEIGKPFASEFVEIRAEHGDNSKELLMAIFEKIYVELGAVEIARFRSDVTPASLRR